MTTLSKPPSGERPERLFSVQDYHRMISAGILTKNDRVELIEGRIIEKMPTDPPHVLTLELVAELLRKACTPQWIVRVDAPLELSQSEPEPDAMVIAGPRERYADRHPRPEDVLLAVEVSDTTLRDDRGEKASLYSAARIPLYWIVNLKDRCVEVHSDPSGPGPAPAYRRKQDVSDGGTIMLAFPNGATVELAVKEMFPVAKPAN